MIWLLYSDYCVQVYNIQGHTSGVVLVGDCVLITTSGKHGQLTIHDYWAAAAEDKDHTDSW